MGGKKETEHVGYKRHPEKAAYVEKTPSLRFFFLFAYVGTILHDFVFWWPKSEITKVIPHICNTRQN